MNDSSRDAARQMNFFGIDYPDIIKQQERPQEPDKREEKNKNVISSTQTDKDGAR